LGIEIRYPGAIIRPSEISHPRRPYTHGVCWHWTVGSEPGDITVLDGPNVDCFLYIAKDGDVYQFLDPRDVSWTAKHTANHNSVHIETEGRGEAWTTAQIERGLEAADWLCGLFGIPRRRVDPPADWRGHYGHADLKGIDGNDHWDTIPSPPGWDVFIRRLQGMAKPIPPPPPPLPKGNTLRLVIGGKLYAGWENAAGPIAWVARNGAKDPNCFITWNRDRWNGPQKVTGVCRNLNKRFLEPRRKAA
jgi:hypothetical protein